MALRLSIVSRHAEKLGSLRVKEFGPSGGTIGRARGCAWALPDPKRYLSGRHASIDFRSGSYYIVDTSTNGVYVNGADHPVGRGKPQRLFTGDRIRFGEYDIAVEVDEDTIEPLINERYIDPVDRAQRVEAPEPTGEDLVDAFEVTGVGYEMQLTDDEFASLTPPKKAQGAEIELVFDDDGDHARTIPHLGGLMSAARAVERPKAKAPAAAARSAATQTKPASSPAATPTKPAAAPPPQAAKPAAAPSAARNAAATPAAPAAKPAGAPVATTAQAKPRPVKVKTPPTLTLEIDEPPAASKPATVAKPTPPPAASKPVTVAKPTPPAFNSGGARSLTPAVEAFCRGAGLEPQRLDAQQTEAMMHTVGQLIREMIVGMSEALHLRAEQKNTLRLPSTTIQPQDNNPLKFSAGVEETLQNLLLRDSPQYLPPVEAVRDAYADLKQHQQALLKALRDALEAFVSRLDPDDLEQKFARGRGRLIGAASKLKYWDLYKDLYDVVAHHPPGELPMQFLDDFAHAYERELGETAADEAPAARRRKAV